MKVLLLIAALAAALASPVLRAADAPKVELKDGDRVAFIGNTFVEREQKDCYIETALTSRFPDRNITFRNLGYSADTTDGAARGLCAGWSVFENPEKAFQRLRKLVAEYKPTVLIINYGMTESFSGPQGIADFTAGYSKMLDALSEAAGGTPRLVLMSPNYHEDMGRPLPDPTEHNKNLELYSEAIAGIAKARGAVFVDLFSLTKSAGAVKLTSNGIHLTPFGYWCTARAIEEALGYRHGQQGWVAEVSGTGKGEPAARGAKVSNVAAGPAGLSFDVKAELLPAPPVPATNEMETQFGKSADSLIRIADLKPGNYQLKVGADIVATGSAMEWDQAVVKVPAKSAVAQVEELRKLIVAKNFDYFNYQRPDNDSYILAFRKGEQGRNAVEIPRFLPLVEEKEKQIAALRVPKPVTYTLEAVK